MGIAAAEESVKSSYSIDGAGTSVTQGPYPNTMASESFAPAVKATPPCGFTSSLLTCRGDNGVTARLVKFGGGLCAPAHSDDNLNRHRRD